MTLWHSSALRRPLGLLGLALTLAAYGLVPSLAQAQNPPTSSLVANKPGLLLGGGNTPLAPQTDVDPLLPTGAVRTFPARPLHLLGHVCSLLTPVCLNYSISSPPPHLEGILADFEQAYVRLVQILQLPAPLPDLGLGPSSGLDLYLDPTVSPASDLPAGLRVLPDPPPTTDDLSSAHCRVFAGSWNSKYGTALCVASAIALGVNAGATPHLRRSIASYLVSLWALTDRELSEVDQLQANPQLTLIGRDLSEHTSSAWPLIAYLDQQLGTTPGSLAIALLQQSRGSTPSDSVQWHNEPDSLEVLRQALETEERFGNFFLNFAVQRAFWGTRDAAREVPAMLWTQDAGRVRFDWVLQTKTLPRRVAARRPVEALGSAYLWLQIDDRKPNTTLAFRSEWEPPGNFRWTLVAVDSQGSELRRFDLPYVRGATSAERTLPDVPHAVGFVIVGFNLGGVDSKHPFDPDHEPWEPHGFTVYLAEVEIEGSSLAPQ